MFGCNAANEFALFVRFRNELFRYQPLLPVTALLTLMLFRYQTPLKVARMRRAWYAGAMN
jgi:hypothetical protein